MFLQLTLLFGLVIASEAQKQYVLTTQEDSFTVSIANTVIFSHTTSTPMIYVGKGQRTFNEFHGNFHIKDYVQDRIELGNFSISSTSSTDQITFSYATYEVEMVLVSAENHPLVVSFTNVGAADYSIFWLRVKAEAAEQVYGCGEQYSYFNLRGRGYPIWTREQATLGETVSSLSQRYLKNARSLLHPETSIKPGSSVPILGVGRNKSDQVTFFADKLEGAGGDYYTTYFPQPTFYSSRRYYCHYSGSNYAVFNFDHADFHELYIAGVPLQKFYFNADTSIAGLVKKFSAFMGRQPELPSWVYNGAILGIQGGTELMLKRLADAQTQGVPVSGLWIQDWAGRLQTSFGSRLFWNWQWDPNTYPDLNVTITKLKAKGIRVLAYINPNINIKGSIFKEGDAKGYFIKNADNTATFTNDFGEFKCATVDLTNPAAYNWYKDKIKTNMIDLGLGGWMADFGEYVPATGIRYYSGESPEIVHNKFPALWAKVNREAVEERNKLGEVVFWMRAGFSGTQNYTTLMWAGDQNVDFSYGDGLPSTIPAALSLGLSGVGLTHYDIGGYTTFGTLGLRRSPELLLRSAEAAIFTPVFRTHEGNQPKSNTQFYTSPAIQQAFGRLARIFVYISNYTKSLVKENSVNGTPVQRPLLMQYPNDPQSQNVAYQYMFGPDVLVAPVIVPNVTKWSVYLPPDSWTFLWTGVNYTGGNVNVTAPLGQPPVFYRQSSAYAGVFKKIPAMFPLPPTPSTKVPPTTKVPSTNATSLLWWSYPLLITSIVTVWAVKSI